MQINLKAPSNQNFIDVILGIEMTNYFTDVKRIFSIYILNDNRPKTKIILGLFILILGCVVIINFLKFIFEINTRLVWSIHLFYFLEVVFDIGFMVICLLYITQDKNLDFEINLEEFESHLKYINILWYTKTFYALLVIFFPFKFFSLISWWKSVFERLIILLNVIFRMGPGIIISLFFFMIMILMFIFINYFLFNDIFPYYETIYKSFISTFDIRILLTIYNRRPASKIFGNLFQSKYSVVVILFQSIFFYFFFAIIIATLVYTYKKALILQSPEEENKYMIKLEEIEKKLKEDKLEEFKNIDLLKKHILWWNIDDINNYTINNVTTKYKAIFFKNYNQIISFLKYIFAVRPEIQFMKLIYKINIIIETNQKKLKDKEIRQISNLAEWLIFVGSKIPIIIYSKSNPENSIKMKLKNLYKLTYFINDENSLEKKLEENGNEILKISKNQNLSFLSKIEINYNNKP